MASGNKVNAIKESVSRFGDVADFRKMARSLETRSPLSSFALSVKRKMASLLLCSREVWPVLPLTKKKETVRHNEAGRGDPRWGRAEKGRVCDGGGRPSTLHFLFI